MDKKVEYILALKRNQGSLHEDVELFATEQKAKGSADIKMSRNATIDGDHGRIERRTATAIHDEWLHERPPAVPAIRLSSWSKARARSAEKPSKRHAITSTR